MANVTQLNTVWPLILTNPFFQKQGSLGIQKVLTSKIQTFTEYHSSPLILQLLKLRFAYKSFMITDTT